jgi:hypothetical protein
LSLAIFAFSVPAKIQKIDIEHKTCELKWALTWHHTKDMYAQITENRAVWRFAQLTQMVVGCLVLLSSSHLCFELVNLGLYGGWVRHGLLFF